jgi:hypothetical protein
VCGSRVTLAVDGGEWSGASLWSLNFSSRAQFSYFIKLSITWRGSWLVSRAGLDIAEKIGRARYSGRFWLKVIKKDEVTSFGYYEPIIRQLVIFSLQVNT